MNETSGLKINCLGYNVFYEPDMNKETISTLIPGEPGKFALELPLVPPAEASSLWEPCAPHTPFATIMIEAGIPPTAAGVLSAVRAHNLESLRLQVVAGITDEEAQLAEKQLVNMPVGTFRQQVSDVWTLLEGPKGEPLPEPPMMEFVTASTRGVSL